jgi:hypothetical protein
MGFPPRHVGVRGELASRALMVRDPAILCFDKIVLDRLMLDDTIADTESALFHLMWSHDTFAAMSARATLCNGRPPKN